MKTTQDLMLDNGYVLTANYSKTEFTYTKVENDGHIQRGHKIVIDIIKKTALASDTMYNASTNFSQSEPLALDALSLKLLRRLLKEHTR